MIRPSRAVGRQLSRVVGRRAASRAALLGAAALLTACGATFPLRLREEPSPTPQPTPLPTLLPLPTPSPSPVARIGPNDPVVPLVATPTTRRAVTIISWDDYDDESPTARAQRTLRQFFHDKNPAIRVDAKPRPPADVIGLAFQMAGASGTLPDVFPALTPDQIGPFSEARIVAPIESFTKNWPLASRVPPRVWDAFRTDAHVYGLPNFADVMGLVWRKDFFIDVELDPEKPPRTWDDLVTMGKKLTRPDRSRYGFGLVGGPKAAEHWQNYVWQAGGNLTRPADKGRLRLTFADATGAEALRFYQDARAKHRFVQATPAAEEPALTVDFLAGPAAMILAPVSFLARVPLDQGLDQRIGFAALPAGPRGNRGAAMRASAYAIGERGIAEARAAAWTYISWLSDPEQVRTRWKLVTQNGGIIVPEISLSLGLRQADHTDRTRKHWETGIQDAVTTARPEYAGRAQLEPFLAQAINTVLLVAGSDAAATLRDAAARAAAAFPEELVNATA